MSELIKGATCWFLNDTFKRTSGQVAGWIVWRGDTLVIIEHQDGGDIDFVVRPKSLVSSCPDAAIGFAMHDDDLMVHIADMVLSQRHL